MDIYEPGEGHKPSKEKAADLSALDIYVPGGQQIEQPDTQLEALSLVELLTNPDLVAYILHSHTFFHGKVGFYEPILRRIYKLAGLDPTQIKYVHTARNFPKNSATKKLPVPLLVLLPIVESEEALNRLLANAFSKASAVWLIGRTSFIQDHLLVSFRNFFITSSTESEVSSLCDILGLPREVFSDLTADSERPYALFATDFEPLVKQHRCFSVAAIHLNGLG